MRKIRATNKKRFMARDCTVSRLLFDAVFRQVGIHQVVPFSTRDIRNMHDRESFYPGSKHHTLNKPEAPSGGTVFRRTLHLESPGWAS